jgi:hypothetical protein
LGLDLWDRSRVQFRDDARGRFFFRLGFGRQDVGRHVDFIDQALTDPVPQTGPIQTSHCRRAVDAAGLTDRQRQFGSSRHVSFCEPAIRLGRIMILEDRFLARALAAILIPRFPPARFDRQRIQSRDNPIEMLGRLRIPLLGDLNHISQCMQTPFAGRAFEHLAGHLGSHAAIIHGFVEHRPAAIEEILEQVGFRAFID